MRFIPLISLCLLTACSASAQDTDPNRLNDLSRQQAEAQARQDKLEAERKAVRTEIDSLRRDLVKAASEAESYERAARKTEQALADLKIKEALLQTKVYGDRKTLMQLLAALQRIERNPPPALAASPDDIINAARAATLTAGIAGELKDRADRLVGELDALNAVRADITVQREKLSQNEKALEAKRANISTLVSGKAKLERSLTADRDRVNKQVAALAAEANSLRDLIRQFERSTRSVTPRLKPPVGSADEEPDTPRNLRSGTGRLSEPITLPPGTAPFAQAKGKLRAPVRGTLRRSYSSSHTGLSVETRSKAQVIAPYSGRVEFAGPFKNYENVVILNVGDGWFILLTGLGEVYAASGESVTAGEPVGLMPFNTQGAPELYIEFRKDGKTVSPVPWLGKKFAG